MLTHGSAGFIKGWVSSCSQAGKEQDSGLQGPLDAARNKEKITNHGHKPYTKTSKVKDKGYLKQWKERLKQLIGK